jgi:hypothetical protein
MPSGQVPESSQNTAPTEPEDPLSKATARRASRRTVFKGTVATVGAVAASSYVKPSLTALGVPSAFAQVSPNGTPGTTGGTSGTGPNKSGGG